MARVLGVGGVFFKCDDPGALGAWYARWLGVDIDGGYGGSQFDPAAMPPGGYTVWGPFRKDTEYFAPSDRPFMINLVVDDLDGALAQVAEGGAQVLEETMDEPYGRFGWFVDPAGTKVELWEPRDGTADA